MVVDIILGICGIHKVMYMYMQYLGFFFFDFFFLNILDSFGPFGILHGLDTLLPIVQNSDSNYS